MLYKIQQEHTYLNTTIWIELITM